MSEQDEPWVNLPESDKGMSNFGPSIDDGLEEDLRNGMRATHAAWNFNGQIWYDKAAGVFREDVFRYHASVGIRSAPALEELMAAVNDEFGWD